MEEVLWSSEKTLYIVIEHLPFARESWPAASNSRFAISLYDVIKVFSLALLLLSLARSTATTHIPAGITITPTWQK